MLVTDIPEFAPYEGEPAWDATDWTGFTADFGPLGKVTFLYRGQNYVVPRSNKGETRWVAICELGDCDNVFVAAPKNVLLGLRRSCGCLKRGLAAIRGREVLSNPESDIDPVSGLCAHSECTGSHDSTGDTCPAAQARENERERSRYRRDAEYRERTLARQRTKYAEDWKVAHRKQEYGRKRRAKKRLERLKEYQIRDKERKAS